MHRHEATDKNLLLAEIEKKLQDMTEEQKQKVLEAISDEKSPA